MVTVAVPITATGGVLELAEGETGAVVGSSADNLRSKTFLRNMHPD
jgi:hypothetical protein